MVEIYKYVTAERIDILLNQKIRFTQPTELNDPFDSNPTIAPAIHGGLIHKQLHNDASAQFLTTIERLRKSFPNTIEHGDRESVIESIADEHLQRINSDPGLRNHVYQETINEEIGILSLSSERNHPLMWSHYAATHTGFVLGITEEANLFTIPPSKGIGTDLLLEIFYSKQRPIVEFGRLSLKHLTVKSKYWRYEKEFRVITELININHIHYLGNKKLFLKQFNPKGISSILLGYKIHHEVEKRIKEILISDDFKHVRLQKTQLNLINYQFDIVDLN